MYGSNYLTYVHESGDGYNDLHTFENFPFNTSQWYNIVVVRKISDKISELYINGDKVGEVNFIENPSNGGLSFLRIGENQQTIQNERFFHGTIDDLIIFNKSLSNREVEQLYNFQNKFI